MTNCWKCKIPCKPVTATCTLGFIVRAERCQGCNQVYYSDEELEVYELKGGEYELNNKHIAFIPIEGVWVETIAATE